MVLNHLWSCKYHGQTCKRENLNSNTDKHPATKTNRQEQENTIRAFAAAWSMGADAVELDVRVDLMHPNPTDTIKRADTYPTLSPPRIGYWWFTTTLRCQMGGP